MLIDINAYVGNWPFQQLQYNTVQSLLERMNKFGVDISVISNLNAIFYKNSQAANEELYEELASSRRYKGRFIQFGVINPIYAGWQDDLETCVNKLQIKGFRLYPQYHDYEITDPACIDLVKRIRDYDLPVSFNMRMVDSRQRSWMDLGKEWNLKNILPIIRAVPDAKYMILNYTNNVALNQEEMTLLKKSKIVFDTSGRAITNMAKFLERFGVTSTAFGTHSPMLDYLTGLLRIESLSLEEADEATRDLLRSGNARQMLNI